MPDPKTINNVLVFIAASLWLLAIFAARWAVAGPPQSRQKWLRRAIDAKGAAMSLVAFAGALSDD